MMEGGYHFLIDLEGCSAKLLNDKDRLLKLCRDLAGLIGARVLKEGVYQFKPQGITAFVVIADSHISIHTWPESGKAFLDVFTCSENFNADRTLDFIQGKLGGKRGKATLILRDSTMSRVLYNGSLALGSITFDFGRTIFSRRSRFQKIELTKGPMGVSLFLDGYWQFVEKYEQVYHETLVHPAMVCAERLARVGIAGGGDGLAIREVLRYPELGRVWLYEIDDQMLALAKRHPEMIRLNRRALEHPKACVVAEDARSMLVPQARFDVLILDFPSMSDGSKFKKLYSTDIYRQAQKAMAPNGVLVTQVTDFPWNLRRTIRNLRRIFPHVIPIDVGFNFSLFNFVMASARPMRQRRPLPPGLQFMTFKRLKTILQPYPPVDWRHSRPERAGRQRSSHAAAVS